MSAKQQLNLYRISRENIFLIAKDKNETLPPDSTNEILIDFIINQIDGRRKPRPLKLKNTIKTFFRPFKISLFFCKVPLEFQWRDFFKDHLTEDDAENASFLGFNTSLHASFLCFLSDDEDIYAFTGGLGNSYIRDFVDDEFGINVLERVGDPDTLHLRMAKNSSIVGNVASDQRYYRGTQKTIDEDNLGKVYNEVVGNVEYSQALALIKELIFDGNDKGRMNIKAKSSLCFAKSLTFSDLKIILNFIKALPENSNFQFSKVKSLSGRRGHEKILIENLDKKLLHKIYNFFLEYNRNTNYIDDDLLEISHSKFDVFYKCTTLTLRRPGNKNIYSFESPFGLTTNQLLSTLCEKDLIYINENIEEINRANANKKNELIEDFICKYSLSCFDNETDEDDPVFDKKISYFIHCEITDNAIPYFKLTNKWYKSEENFLRYINEEFRKIFKDSKLIFPLSVKWGQDAEEDLKENENTYLDYIADNLEPNTLVFHKIIPPEFQMELCDLVHWDDDNIYLIHVKPSFDGAVRVLEKQISHSSQLIGEDLRTEATQNHLGKYFNRAKLYEGTDEYLLNIQESLSEITSESFYTLFREKTINFVACIVDTKSKRKLENIESFKSSIAKMCLIDGYRSIRKNSIPGSRFRISEIEVEEDYDEP